MTYTEIEATLWNDDDIRPTKRVVIVKSGGPAIVQKWDWDKSCWQDADALTLGPKTYLKVIEDLWSDGYPRE